MRLLHYTLPLVLLACQSTPGNQQDAAVADDTATEASTRSSIERVDPAFDRLIAPDAAIEVLGEGFDWSEGPVWIEDQKMLLFSDIPPNSIFRWTEADGVQLYLKPSGYTGEIERTGEPGSNGLLLDPEGRLVLCQHGDRRVARYTGSWDDPSPQYETVVAHYDGKRFNSPNDATYHSNGDLYFTDPPYGLEGNVDDPAKEIPFQGVYRFDTDGGVTLLTDNMSRPNGIAFAPDFSTLYVANSDPDKAVWMAYPVKDDGTISDGRLLQDATALVGQEKGLPDGLKVHSDGTIFATGPGGVWVMDPSGKVLGKIKTGQATANCAFDTGYKHLYITADMYLMRVKLIT